MDSKSSSDPVDLLDRIATYRTVRIRVQDPIQIPGPSSSSSPRKPGIKTNDRDTEKEQKQSSILLLLIAAKAKRKRDTVCRPTMYGTESKTRRSRHDLDWHGGRGGFEGERLRNWVGAGTEQ